MNLGQTCKLLWQVVLHVAATTAICAGIVLAAALLNVLAHYLEVAWHVSPWLIYCILALEVLLFVFDFAFMVIVLCFLMKSAYRDLKSLSTVEQ